MPYCSECAAPVPEAIATCPTCGASLVATPTAIDDGQRPVAIDAEAIRDDLEQSLAPHYELLKPLGVGGMGAVFLARQPALKRLVAVKVLAPHLAVDDAARTRFEREGTAAAALSHPNIVRVYSVGETDNERLPYIIMQHVDGPTLAQWSAQQERVTERDARRIIGDIAAALAAAHQRDLAHRDVKPSNVLIEADSGRAYVADFGVSAALSTKQQIEQTKLTATGMVIGTPVYMSPEQAGGEAVTPKSDVYSLGMLAYELVTGELPFSASNAMGWIAAHMRDTPTPVATARPDLGPEVLKLIDRCLAKDPNARPSADEVARGMLPSLATEIDWPPPGLGSLHQRADKLARQLLVTSAGGIVAAVAVAYTPTILRVHPNWLQQFEVARLLITEELQLRATPTTAGDVAFFAWQALLFVGSLLFVVGTLYVTAHLARLLRDGARQYRLGWQRTTLVDVAVDWDGRSGLLLAGAREFASLEPARRETIVQLRRWRAAGLLAGLAWPTLVMGAWVVLAGTSLFSGRGPDPIISAALPTIAVLPALVALLAGVGADLRERRLLGPLARAKVATASSGDIERWYASLPFATDGRRSAPTTTRRWPVRLLLIAGGVSGVIVAVGFLELAMVSVIAARFVQREGPQTAELLATLEGFAERDQLATLQRMWAPYLPTDVEPLDDSTAVAIVRTLTTAAGQDLAPFPVERDDLSIRLEALVDVLGSGNALRPDERDLDEFGDHPRTRAFRQLAGATPVAFSVVSLDKPMHEYSTIWEVPFPRLRSVMEAATANAIAAMVAFDRGDRPEALHRLGENVAVAEQLLAHWTLIGNLVGATILRTSALTPLAVIEDARGDSAQAAALRDASRQIRSTVRVNIEGTPGLLVDPNQPAGFVAAITNPSITVGSRYEMIVSGWGAICGSPWELLAGPSTERLDMVTALADSLPNLPMGRVIAELSDAGLRKPWSVFRPVDRTPFGTFAQWSPVMVWWRLRRCTFMD